MTLSPTDVEQKTFSTALRGYDLDEVDDFLDQVVATIRDLTEQLAAARQAPSTVERPVGPAADESAVGRALVAAQETADQIVAEARREAERIIQQADTEADALVSERDRRRSEAEAEMAELAERIGNVRSRLAVLATAVADRLDEMDAAIGAAIDMADEGEEPETSADDQEPYAEAAATDDEDAEDDEEGELHIGRFESGRHADDANHVDVNEDNVEELILDDTDGAEEMAEAEEVAEGSERNW